MRPRPSVADLSLAGTGTALVFLLALAQLFWAAFRATGAGAGVGAVLGVSTLVVAVLHARKDSFDSRLMVDVVCGVQVVLMGLAVVIGLPGQPRHPVDRAALVALVLPIVIITLLVADQCRARRRRDDARPSSYAL